MGDLVFVLLVVGGLGTFFYVKMRQYTAEQAQQQRSVAADEVAETAVEEPVAEASVAAADKTAVEVEATAAETVAQAADADDLALRVLSVVRAEPGVLQVALYKRFPDENRKVIQTTLLQLDKNGSVRREKSGNSYKVFAV